MKELKIEDIMPLEEVKSKIWMILDILRNENISSNTANNFFCVYGCT